MMKKFELPKMHDVVGKFHLGVMEWISLGATLIFAGVVAFYYFNSTQPLRSKLSELRTREKKLQNEMMDEAQQRQKISEQRANADKILDSLDRFEARLHNRKVGITAIIDEVNQIAKVHHVQAGDISFRTETPEPLPGEPTPGASPTRAPITKRDKLPVVYEGLGLDTTVEGDYADLRRFISALERSRNFVIINALTLQSIDERQRSKFRVPVPGATMGPAGGQLGGAPAMEAEGPTKIVVALKIEMETHFARIDRPESQMMPANAPVQR
jgi:hypothetical protein